MGKRAFSTCLIVVSLVLISSLANLVSSEVFTSLEDMNMLVSNEIEITAKLREFLDGEYRKLFWIKALLDDFEKLANTAKEKEPEKFVGNPINSFLIIKKLSKDLQRFVDMMNSIEKLKDLVEQIKDKYVLPTDVDYEGAIIALHRLEDTYALNPSDIRTGNLSQKYKPYRELTAHECFEIGRVAYEQKDYYHTIRWMAEAINQAEIEGDNSTVNVVDAYDYLSFATAQQGNLNHAFLLTERILELEPNHERAKSNLEYYKKALKEQVLKLSGDTGNNAVMKKIQDPFDFVNKRPESVLGEERDSYEALCRGEKLKKKGLYRKNRHLKCRYVNYHPLLYLMPVKEELVNADPPIWLYHDVITEKEVELMKTLAYPKLKRAIVRSPVTGEFVTADYRISKSGWLHDDESPKLAFLTKFVSAVTNMSMETAEEWQIANYGIGGQYDPHFDFARRSEPADAFHSGIGNRVATWLFYLETPEIGGATVFPSIGARIQPYSRTAAFWYNLFTSGDGDYRTRHAACPVLLGTKWVSNKWLHLVGQEFRRPCNLVREKSIESI